MNLNELKEIVSNSDRVLIGIGEEFEEGIHKLRMSEVYRFFQNKCRKENLVEEDYSWLYPIILKIAIQEEPEKDVILRSYHIIEQILRSKDYFIVTMNMDDAIYLSDLDRNRIVAPFGNYTFYQCLNGCDNDVWMDEEFTHQCEEVIQNPSAKLSELKQKKCSKCGAPITFNTVNSQKYVEEAYIDKWSAYMNWLQGTLNKKTCIIEMGVMLNFPSIIRWPFEKTAYLNQKATLIRINGKYPQLSEDTAERGVSVPMNSLEFLQSNK